jgi:adenine-specific DNA-methyltransferase
MATWEPRSSTAWAELLGMVRVPMFDAARSHIHAGQHAVILDGKSASFSLSIGNADALLDLAGPVSWSWSANVRHSVIIDESRDVCLIRRWDAPSSLQEHPIPDATQATQLPQRFQCLEHPELPTVVDRSLQAFRFVRNGIEELRGTDIDAIRVFNCLLMWAEVSKGQSAVSSSTDLATAVSYLSEHALLNYHPEDFSQSVRAYRLSEAVDLLLKGKKNEPYFLDTDLLIRHAGGTLFQEAHIEIEKSSLPHRQPTLFLELWASDEPRHGKAKRDAHFTPPTLARLLVEQSLAELTRIKGSLPTAISVLDPACGSGVFFIETIRELSGGTVASLDMHGFDNTTISRIMSEFSLQRTIEDYSSGKAVFEIFQGDSLQVLKWGEPSIILMNPPFSSWSSMSRNERAAVKATLGNWYSGHSDSALAFLAKAVRSLRPGSVLGSVVPAALLESKAAEKFRRSILASSDISIRLIGRFRGYGYFRDAIVEPAFIVLSRNQRKPGDKIRFLLAESGHEDKSIRASRNNEWTNDVEGDGFELFSATYDAISPISWMPRPRRGDKLLRGLSAKDTISTVGKLFDTNLGVRPGLKRAFLVPASSLKRLAPTANERRYFRPVADTISNAKIIPDTYIFYPYGNDGKLTIKSEADLSRAVPVFYRECLLADRDNLAARRSQRNRHWWELVEPRPTWQGRREPKIVSQAFGKQGGFAFDDTGECVVVQGVAWLIIDHDLVTTDLPWAYVALLNSEIFERIIGFYCPRVGGGQYEVYPKYVDQLPIPDLKKSDARTKSFLAKTGREMASGGQIDQHALNRITCAAYGTAEIDFQRAFPSTEKERLSLRFAEFSSRWKKETAHHSSMAQMAKHPAYQQILDLGPEVVRLILEDLKRRPAMWFHALQTLTGANPVKKESRGILRDMRLAWLEWGRENGYDV